MKKPKLKVYKMVVRKVVVYDFEVAAENEEAAKDAAIFEGQDGGEARNHETMDVEFSDAEEVRA